LVCQTNGTCAPCPPTSPFSLQTASGSNSQLASTTSSNPTPHFATPNSSLTVSKVTRRSPAPKPSVTLSLLWLAYSTNSLATSAVQTPAFACSCPAAPLVLPLLLVPAQTNSVSRAGTMVWVRPREAPSTARWPARLPKHGVSVPGVDGVVGRRSLALRPIPHRQRAGQSDWPRRRGCLFCWLPLGGSNWGSG